jgi:phosphoenolpyruvate carboxykinase (ATP)
MPETINIKSTFGLENNGLTGLKKEYWNLCPSALIERIVCLEEGIMGEAGAVIVNTLPCSGRSPDDKFIVKDPDFKDDPVHWGKINRSITPEQFDRLYEKVTAYLQGREVYVQDMYAGADPEYRLPIRIVTEHAWQSLFANNLFIRPGIEDRKEHKPVFTLIAVPDFHADPQKDGIHSDVFIAVDFGRKMVLIGGSRYAGEIKKSIFTVMNYLLPLRGVLPMHCSANVSEEGEVALFFGLSGTGKTTLSSDPERRLIGDDEHGWGDHGVFNFEGGCYAKMIRLRKDLEPLIWEAARGFGAVLENVVIDPLTRDVDFDDSSYTENTRGAYPLDYVPNHVPEGQAGHPRNVFFLTADASGVLPPLARLTRDQAMYFFLSGYTSKLAGTETGLGSEPKATFSTCFGAPFLPLNPNVYACLLGDKILKHDVKVWLVNTGWTGGPAGVGKRMYLPYTRAMIKAALTGALDNVPTRIDPSFSLEVPVECPGVPSELLDPRSTWADPDAYDEQAKKLTARFQENFKQFEADVPKEVCEAAPHQIAAAV